MCAVGRGVPAYQCLLASAAFLTISQNTFGFMPWPQICPDLLIALKRQPASTSRFSPAINGSRHPEWNRNRPNVPGLAVEVGNHPMLFPEELNGTDGKRKNFTAPQAATDQKCKYGVVPLASQAVTLRLQTAATGPGQQ